MISLSLHSGGSERSYLRALIYDQDICFGFFFPFDLFLELRHLWVPRRKPSVVKLLWKIKVYSDVLTVVSNKEKCGISFAVFHSFSLEICLLILYWFYS